jgi:glycerol-3-phosphate O-acyltransferase / dihydroxyacetone phosphate acyltransferase
MSFLLDALKLFIQICLNTFFRDIKVRGFHQIPKEGPLLFAIAPHSNQFVDPLILTITCGRNVGFLAAKKSMDWNVCQISKFNLCRKASRLG